MEIVSCLSLKFEKGTIQAFEVPTEVEKATSTLQDLLEEEDVMGATMDKAGFTLQVHDGELQLSISLPKEGHMRRSVPNREYTTLTLSLNRASVEQLQHGINTLKERSLPALKTCLDGRFNSFNKESLFQDMMWVDPANWRSDITEELESIKAVAEHFEVTLASAGYDGSKIKREWKDLKIIARNIYKGVAADGLWEQILQYRRTEHPNLCLLVEVVLSVGVSNSTVEEGI